MVSVCLPSDALLQHLPSYLGFSYLGRGVSLHGCSSKVQPLFLTLDEGYLLTATLPDLQHGIAPLGPPAPEHAASPQEIVMNERKEDVGAGGKPRAIALLLSWGGKKEQQSSPGQEPISTGSVHPPSAGWAGGRGGATLWPLLQVFLAFPVFFCLPSWHGVSTFEC